MAHDVAIVGAGPVGLAAAIGLKQAGFSVVLIERGDRSQRFSIDHDHDRRVYAIAPESARLFDALGLWSGIMSARISPYRSMRVWDRDPARALAFDATDAGITELGWIVEHALIADRLWSAFSGIDCLLGVKVESLQLPDNTRDYARITLVDGREIDARLVIAADGADSQLRELAGIETVSWRYGQRALIGNVRTRDAHRMTAFQRFLPTGPLALLPLADGRCSIVWSAETVLADELMALEDAAFCARLGEASQGVLGDVIESGPRIAIPLRLLHAQEYGRDGFALIGDAAHAIHPLAGQGLNLGLADVAQLIATLVEARDAGRDWRSERTLARYARARKAANLEMLAVTDSLSRAFSLRLPGLRTALGLGMESVDRLGPVKELLMRQAAGA